MSAPVDRAAAPPIVSPCIGLCQIDREHDMCAGCGRTLEEIAGWSAGTVAWRASVMASLGQRLATRD